MARLDLDTVRIVPTTQKRDREQSHREQSHREEPDQESPASLMPTHFSGQRDSPLTLDVHFTRSHDCRCPDLPLDQTVLLEEVLSISTCTIISDPISTSGPFGAQHDH
jgi:hypothetical protein